MAFACARFADAQELRELSIQRFSEVPEMPTVMADYPEQAYLVFLSPISNLQFETNWIIYDDLSEPDEGRYLLVVDTVRQVLRVSVPDQFRATELNIPKLQARQTLYYTIEPANTRQLDLARQDFEQGAYESAISRLNGYVLIDNLTAAQRARAYQLSALCFYEMEEPAKMRQALYSLLQVAPNYLPDVIANPPVINAFVTAYRDSVSQAVPARPQGVAGAYRDNTVVLNWRLNNAHDITHYNIYRSQQTGTAMDLLDTVDADVNQFVDLDVAPFESYHYQISAVDNFTPAQEGDRSHIVSVFTLPPLIDRIEMHDAHSPAVQDVSVQAVSDSVFSIVYDLVGDLRRTYDVALSLSDNDGASFNLIPNAVRGDVGMAVQDGDRKQITWNVLADYPSGLSAKKYVIKLEAVPLPLTSQITLIADPDSLISQYGLRSEGDGLLTIFYTLRPARKHRYTVDIVFSREANSAYGIVPRAIEGDWGTKKKGGKTYEIRWRLLDDLPGGLTGPITLKLLPSVAPASQRNLWLFTASGAALVGGAAWLLLNDPGKQVVASTPPGRP